jgi:hypothetical protein
MILLPTIISMALQRPPQLVSDKKLKPFMSSMFVPSPANEKPGYYVFNEPRLDIKTLNQAQKHLTGILVDCIIRKEPDGSFVAWTLNGKPHQIAPNDIPDLIRPELKVGEPVIKLRESLTDFKR